MARRKKKKLIFSKKFCFLITLIVLVIGLILLILNRTKPKEIEYSIQFHEAEAEIYIGDVRKFGYTIVNPKGNDKLSWTTTNSKVATVDIDGSVRGVSFGDVTIIAELENGSRSEMKIHVKSYPVYLRLKTDFSSEEMRSGWINKKVNITLETLNVDNIKYCVSKQEECYEYKNYKDKITLSDGIWYVYVMGIDKNGKTIDHHEVFKVDLIPPKCDITRIGKLNEDGANVEVICVDDASGVDKYEWYRDNERVARTTERQLYLREIYKPGKHRYSVKVFDLVGNSSTYEIN